MLTRSGGITFGIVLAAIGAAGWLTMLHVSVGAAVVGLGVSVAVIASLTAVRR